MATSARTKLVPAFPNSLAEYLPHLGHNDVVKRMRAAGVALTPENYHGFAGLPEEEWGDPEAEDVIPEPFRLVWRA